MGVFYGHAADSVGTGGIYCRPEPGGKRRLGESEASVDAHGARSIDIHYRLGMAVDSAGFQL